MKTHISTIDGLLPYIGKAIRIRTPNNETTGILESIDKSKGIFYIREESASGHIAFCPFHWDSAFELYEVISSQND